MSSFAIRWFVPLVATLLTLACGTGGLAGQQPAPDRPRAATDQDIWFHVRQELDLADFLEDQDVTVRVEDGVVYLSGTVDEPYAKEEMVRIARSVEGVREVVVEPVVVSPGVAP